MPQTLSFVEARKRALAKIQRDGGQDRRLTLKDMIRHELQSEQEKRDIKKGRHKPSRAPYT